MLGLFKPKKKFFISDQNKQRIEKGNTLIIQKQKYYVNSKKEYSTNQKNSTQVIT